MFNKALISSLSIFLVLMVFTSSIKHKTRTLEKKINVLKEKIISLKKDLKDAKTDYVYLSSPEQLEKYLIVLDIKDYVTFDTSSIFGYLAIILAAVNIFGGFLVTQRMLQMYKKKKNNKKWFQQIYQQYFI